MNMSFVFTNFDYSLLLKKTIQSLKFEMKEKKLLRLNQHIIGSYLNSMICYNDRHGRINQCEICCGIFRIYHVDEKKHKMIVICHHRQFNELLPFWFKSSRLPCLISLSQLFFYCKKKNIFLLFDCFFSSFLTLSIYHSISFSKKFFPLLYFFF